MKHFSKDVLSDNVFIDTKKTHSIKPKLYDIILLELTSHFLVFFKNTSTRELFKQNNNYLKRT